jgi:phenylacetate-CoA ligase
MSTQSQQLDSLRNLIAEIRSGNSFYSSRLQDAGIAADVASLQAFSAAMPFTTKAELAVDQTENPPYGSNLTYDVARYSRFHQTSGTTGKPMRWLDTADDWQWMLGNWQRVYDGAGVTSADTVFFAFSFGPFLGFWSAFDSAARLGCLCIPGGAMSTTARLRAIVENQVDAVCCTPTYAIRLGQAAAEEDIDLASAGVRKIIVAGEPGGSIPATRALVRDLWGGAEMYDHHGMTEVGPVSYECPAEPGILHVIESAYYAEIIDPTSGEPLGYGSEGELVLTTLGRYGNPLLRYRTGDLVHADSRGNCVCGSDDMRLIGGILGRSDSMVVLRGVNLYPAAVDAVVWGCADIVEYRVDLDHVDGMDEMIVTVETSTACSDSSAAKAALQAALRDAFNIRIGVKLAAEGTLPRYELKARRWLPDGR